MLRQRAARNKKLGVENGAGSGERVYFCLCGENERGEEKKKTNKTQPEALMKIKAQTQASNLGLKLIGYVKKIQPTHLMRGKMYFTKLLSDHMLF